MRPFDQQLLVTPIVLEPTLLPDEFKMNKLLAIGLLALTGCSSTGALNIAPDTYRVSVRVPFSGEAGAQDKALKQANDFCRFKGKTVSMVTQRSNECALHGGCGEAQIDFKCE